MRVASATFSVPRSVPARGSDAPEKAVAENAMLKRVRAISPPFFTVGPAVRPRDFAFPTSHKKNLSSLGINSPDYAHYLLEYDQGIVTVALNYYRKTPKRTIEITTNNDVLIVDLLKYSIFSETEGKMIYSAKIERNELLKRQMSYFLECIKKNQNTMNPISEAYEVLKICLNEESK